MAVVGLGALAVVKLDLRRRMLRWGATDDEVWGALPGDSLLPSANLVATRATTVGASAEAVWPWLAQIGQEKGGFYSYAWLEDLVGCEIVNADRVVPEWQHVEVGDEVHLAPQLALRVAVVEPGRALVLAGISDEATTDATGRAEGEVGPPGTPAGPGAPYDFVWAFTVHDMGDGTSRLVVRERYRYRAPWALLVVEPVEVVSWLMHRKMLDGIRRRAEAGA